MGYLSRLTGAITFDPPVTYHQIKAAQKALENTYGCVELEVDKHKEEVDDGILIRWSASTIVPCTNESMKVYDMEDELDKLIHALGGGRTYSGQLLREGEDSGDIERYIIQDDE